MFKISYFYLMKLLDINNFEKIYLYFTNSLQKTIEVNIYISYDKLFLRGGNELSQKLIY